MEAERQAMLDGMTPDEMADPKALIRVLVRPFLHSEGTHYARFLEVVRLRLNREPQSPAESAWPRITGAMDRLVPVADRGARIRRVAAVATSMWALLADHERRVENGDASPDGLEDIVSMLAAMLTAPPPADRDPRSLGDSQSGPRVRGRHCDDDFGGVGDGRRSVTLVVVLALAGLVALLVAIMTGSTFVAVIVIALAVLGILLLVRDWRAERRQSASDGHDDSPAGDDDATEVGREPDESRHVLPRHRRRRQRAVVRRASRLTRLLGPRSYGGRMTHWINTVSADHVQARSRRRFHAGQSWQAGHAAQDVPRLTGSSSTRRRPHSRTVNPCRRSPPSGGSSTTSPIRLRCRRSSTRGGATWSSCPARRHPSDRC